MFRLFKKAHSLMCMQQWSCVSFAISQLLLVCTLFLGLYINWSTTIDSNALYVGVMCAFAIITAVLFSTRQSTRHVGRYLFSLWLGCILGMITFSTAVSTEDSTLTFSMNATFVVSNCCHLLSMVLKIFSKCFDVANTKSMNSVIMMEVVGFSVVLLVFGDQYLNILLLLVALMSCRFLILLKSWLGIMNLSILVFVGILDVFSRLSVEGVLNIQRYALCTFLYRILAGALLTAVVSKKTALSVWESYLFRRNCWRNLAIVCVIPFELFFVGANLFLVRFHKEWFVVVPMYLVVSLVWLGFHTMALVMCFIVSAKISECKRFLDSLESDGRSFSQILAAKGLRYVSLISYSLVIISLVTTVILFIVGFRTRTGLTVSVFLVLLPVESTVISLMYQLSSQLGGTCVGYALVSPVYTGRMAAGPLLLPPSLVEDASSRATHIVNTMQRFFSFHLMQTHSCDYSTQSVTLDALTKTLRAFFGCRTADGLRLDTYLLYYFGPVLDTGNWALAGNQSLSLDTLLEWWEASCGPEESRLVLVLDTDHSHHWASQISSKRTQHCVCIQTYRLAKHSPRVDVEHSGYVYRAGDFTADWVDYNCQNVSAVTWTRGRVRPTYGLSRCYGNFALHVPSDSEMEAYWTRHLPRVTWPLARATVHVRRTCSYVTCVCCTSRCVHRCRLRWWPPGELDMHHGFKLVRRKV